MSKTAGESYIRDSGVEYVSLRLANIYGPRNLSGPAPAFFKRLSAGEPCTVVDSRRDFVFVEDAVDVFAAAATTGKGVYHVASGTDQSVAQVYAAVVKAMGLDLPAPLSSRAMPMTRRRCSSTRRRRGRRSAGRRPRPSRQASSAPSPGIARTASATRSRTSP